VVFCSNYLLTAFFQSLRLPYPLHLVAVCDKSVAVISPIARRRPREAANNTGAHPRPPVTASDNQVHCYHAAPWKPATTVNWQPCTAPAPPSNDDKGLSLTPNTVDSMHKPVGVISLYSPPPVPWSRCWHRSPPTTTRRSLPKPVQVRCLILSSPLNPTTHWQRHAGPNADSNHPGMTTEAIDSS